MEITKANTRNIKIPLLLVLFFLIIMNGCKNQQKEESSSYDKPNIIYILADDLGYGDIEAYNPKSEIPTPNLNELAEQGIRFTDAHSNSAVCTPTRYGTLTGEYSFRTRLKNGVLWGYGKPLIEKDKETVASFLKKNGYTTACIGKWHLGLGWVKKDPSKEIPNIQWDDKVTPDLDDNVDYSKPVSDGPQEHGFDYSYIIPASLDMVPYCYLRNGKTVEAPYDYTSGKYEDTHGRGIFWREGPVSPDFDFERVLPNFIDTACQYIKNHSESEEPFFLYLPLPAPHTPWLPTEKYQGLSEAGTYGDFVAMVDDQVGKVISTLESLDLQDNTMIIFTSDNGADWRPEDIDEYGHLANYIYKGRKADIYEAGHRIPFIFRWDDIIDKNAVSDEIMCSTDLMATLAGMLKVDLPENAGQDSYNMWPAIVGEKYNSPIRDYTIHHSAWGYFSIRKGDWKYTPHLGSGGFTVPKKIESTANMAPGTLYNLRSDPGERNNLYKEHPELVRELSTLLEPYQKIGE